MAKNHEISVYFSTKAIFVLCGTHRHNFEVQNVVVSKRRMLLSWKVVNRYKFGTSYAFSGSFVLDLRI